MAKERTGLLGRLSRRGRAAISAASGDSAGNATAPVTKPPADRAAVKKAPAKKAPATKKAAAKKVPAQKAPAQKATAQREPVKKKSAAPTAHASKAPVKKVSPAQQRSAVKKATGASTTQSPASKAPASKAPATKAAASKAPAKAAASKAPAKAAATKAPAKAAATKAPATKAAATKRVTAKAGLLPRLPGDSAWTSKEVASLRDALLAEAADLQDEISAASAAYDRVLAEGDPGTGDDSADAGSATLGREHELSLTANSRDLLAQNAHALERLDAGTYGLCEVCGNPIGKDRLKAFPKVTLCVTCKQRENRR